MDNRTNLLKSIRPVIEIETGKSSVFEVFQSRTLRPILKFQNDIILETFANYLAENKVQFFELKEEKKEALIHTVLKKNLALKNVLFGIVLGHFTKEEYVFYFQNKSELNKRIVELLIKRIIDQQHSF